MNFFNRLTGLGKAVVVAAVIAVIGCGLYFSGVTKSLSGSGSGDYDAVVAVNTYSGFSPLVWANGGLEGTEESPMYKKYGLFHHSLESYAFEGESGMKKMNDLMQSLREHTPAAIGGLKVVSVSDYELRTTTDIATGHKTPITLPKSNVLVFDLEQGAKVVIRPSGTEPKIKSYYTTVGASMDEALATEAKLRDDFSKIFQ